MGKKLHPSDIFFRVQTHMVALAKVYVEQHIFEAFLKKVESLEDSNEKKTLLVVLQTFGLSTIYEDRAWFLENDYFSGNKSKAIRKILDSLMKQMRPLAGDLVASFGIPAALRRAKISS
jgi:acyl-CoA oxidase